jgi:beta-1,4-mannooligosaccharide/beta-1,4-mannosyl-N-acetylglucosamine phosphorylase
MPREPFQTPDFVRRLGPVLRPHDCPYPCTLAFNAGVAKLPAGVGGDYAGKYVMVFRNDYGDFNQPADWPGRDSSLPTGKTATKLGIATSDDGLEWNVEDRELWNQEPGKFLTPKTFSRRYDPRLTVLDGRVYLCYAVDTGYGVLGGLAVTDDLVHFEELGHAPPSNRNHVLFPEQIDGKFVRLERPFPQYGNRGPNHAFDIWISHSPDSRYWGEHRLVIPREEYPWVNDKIGPGAPPVRTDEGWLCITHAVDLHEDDQLDGWEKNPWYKRYTCGLLLLDSDEPWKVKGLARKPIIVPEEDYERKGFRGDVIFPGGLLDLGNGTMRIYYGGADTVECAAEAKTSDLLSMIEPL